MALFPWPAGLAAAILLALGLSLVDTRPAIAQGGVVCQYGPASYRRCCTQSYARKPSLGATARANDIDACMGKGGKKSGKPS
ncbi:hypothetical protein [Rhodoplanes roseus]|uniref:Uncharacterized protein n=1 Tax=Rhodoplanes roseus TaxID=29409 RepID=A0A327KTR5_9BRAD|nr:hypothetical protein [Rhodoplanes roseus]RAI42219.1 hypothetical protein CH341_20095 [Rhodoplanes roseus]